MVVLAGRQGKMHLTVGHHRDGRKPTTHGSMARKKVEAKNKIPNRRMHGRYIVKKERRHGNARESTRTLRPDVDGKSKKEKGSRNNERQHHGENRTARSAGVIRERQDTTEGGLRLTDRQGTTTLNATRRR